MIRTNDPISIEANLEEAVGDFSRNDFGAKLDVAYKESRETRYWLPLFSKSQFIKDKDFNLLINKIIK